MVLAASLCFGLLITYCQDTGTKPVTVIDATCRDNAYAVGKILSMSEAERRALPRAQKQANASTILKYRQRGCPLPK